jgi:hypothetical protein
MKSNTMNIRVGVLLAGLFLVISVLFMQNKTVSAVGGLLIMRDGNDDSVVNISESGTTDTVDLFFDPPLQKEATRTQLQI